MKKITARLLILLLMVGFTVSAASAFTPPGLSKKGGLPPGIQRRFIQRVEKDLNYEATIRGIDLERKRIFIQEGTAEIHLLVANDAKIELNGKATTLSNLQVGDQAEIKTNQSNTVVEIKATGGARNLPPQQIQVKGTIKSIDFNRREIIIEDNNSTRLFKLVNTVAYIDNKQRPITELRAGMEVTVANIVGQEVRTIYVKSIATTELNGTVKAVDVNKREIVLQSGNKEQLFRVKADAVIKVNGVTQRLSAITVGTVVTVKIQQDEIIEILVNNGITQVEGRLIAKDTSTTPKITIEINNQIKTYSVSRDVNLSAINVGRQITVFIRENLVIAVHEKK